MDSGEVLAALAAAVPPEALIIDRDVTRSLSHDEAEYDFGFLTIRWMKALGVVQATRLGGRVPEDVRLPALGF